MMSTGSFSNQVFGTLPKQYCIYFYVVCIIAFIVLISSIFGLLYLFTQKNVHYLTYVNAVALIVSYLLSYISARLLYSMCISSLK
jgi:hypothetical protein